MQILEEALALVNVSHFFQKKKKKLYSTFEKCCRKLDLNRTTNNSQNYFLF